MVSSVLAQLKRRLAERLVGAGIESGEARREMELIVEHVCGWRSAQQILRAGEPIEVLQLRAIEAIVEQRCKRVPLQYCFEYGWFFGEKLIVRRGVFIPRTDTETVVVAVEKRLTDLGLDRPTLFEIGTGSGAISVLLLKRNSKLTITACDINPEALAVASANADALGVSNRLELKSGDWRTTCEGKWTGVISNPPYIPRSQAPTLEPEVGVYEPEAALFGGGDDGLDFYREMARHARDHVDTTFGFTTVEVGNGQADAVCGIFLSNKWSKCDVAFDVNGIPRAVTAAAQ